LPIDKHKGSSQRFVAPHDLVEPLLQGMDMELPSEAQRKTIVVVRAWNELMNVPQLLLGEGQGGRSSICPAWYYLGRCINYSLLLEQHFQQRTPLGRKLNSA
jgi:hypothetical protein